MTEPDAGEGIEQHLGGVTAVNTALLEKDLWQKVECPSSVPRLLAHG